VFIVVLLLLAPTLIVIPVSFGASHSFVFPPASWSLRWYHEFFTNSKWTSSLINSIQVGLLSALLATIVGIGAAFGLDRTRFRGRAALRGGFLAPQIVPGIVVAVAIYIVFLPLHLGGTMIGFVLAHTVIAIPFVVICVSTSLAGFDRTVETASASLGATPVTTFRRVTLPLLLPGVLAGFVFSFVSSFEEVVIALFLQTPNLRTLPVQMYESITLQIDPTIAAASSLIVVVTTSVLLIWQLTPRKRKEIHS
jgi:putative spermidine/putrescine transport system permease protein